MKTWKDISIKQYIELYNLKEDEDGIELFINQIAIVKGITANEVENIPFTEFESLKNELKFLANEPAQTDLKKEVVYNGQKYLLKDDLTAFTLGEWIDLDTFNKDCINNMHRILSVLYTKEGQLTYNPAVCDETAEIFFEKMDIETALAAFFFFYLFALNYIPSDSADCSMFQKLEQYLNQMKLQLEQEGHLQV